MNNGFRLEARGLVDRTRPLRFTFDGRAYTGRQALNQPLTA